MEKIREIISNNKTFLILTHTNPDGDAIGSSYALKNALESMGKVSHMSVETPIPSNLQSFVIDSNMNDDLLSEYDIVFCLDCSTKDYLYNAHLIEKGKKSVLIDHHLTNMEYADVNYIDSDACATGAIIYKLLDGFCQMNFIIASLIYVAMVTDTGNFAYSNTNKEAFLIAARLMEYGIDCGSVHDIIETKQKEMLEIYKYALNNIKSYKDDRIMIMILDDEDMLKGVNTDGIIDYIRYIEGVRVACLIKKSSDIYKVSLRSTSDDINVANVAKDFGGGGHKRAAGFSYEWDIASLIDKICTIEV